jgi:hypothetical protein
MTTREFLKLLALNPWPVAAVLLGLPLLAVLWSLLHSRQASRLAPWKYGFAVLTYLACIPGMVSLVILGYSVFFSHENLLDRDLLSTFGPLASMGLTLVVIRRRVAFAELPGFGRLSGLMTLIGLSFALALVINRTRIFVGFFGSIDRLLLLGAAIYGLFQAAAWALFRRRRL